MGAVQSKKDVSGHSAMFVCMLACFLASLAAIVFTIPRLHHNSIVPIATFHNMPNYHKPAHSMRAGAEQLTSAPARRLKRGAQASRTALETEVGTHAEVSKFTERSSEAIVFRPGLPTLDVVRDLNAVADGVADDTACLRRGLKLIAAAGGGALILPPYSVVRSGPLQLMSHTTLFIDRGATLLASEDVASYPIVKPLPSYGMGREGSKRGRRGAFLWGDSVDDVVITGNNGTIDGGGKVWWDRKFGHGREHFDGITLPGLIEFRETHDLKISRLRLVNSPFWTVHPFACKGVIVSDVEIINSVTVGNTDGVNPDSSENVLIKNLRYTGGDDAIAIKSGWDCFGDKRGFNRPSRNISILNVTIPFTRSAAIAIGSEMSGGVENVRIDGLRVEHAGNGGVLGIKTTAARGGFVRHIRLSRVEVGNVEGTSGVFMIAGKFGSWTPEKNPACKGPPDTLPEISDIHVENVAQIEGTRARGAGFIFKGLEEGQTIQRLSLRDIRLVVSARRPVECQRVEVKANGVTFDTPMGDRSWLGCEN